MVASLLERIKARTSQRTGLTSDQDLEAYFAFCKHATDARGIIMHGDVQHELYECCRQGATPQEQAEDLEFNELQGNHRLPQNAKSALQLVAQREMERYTTLFERMQLITAPLVLPPLETPYRFLRGYNYFRDPEFYRVTEHDGGTAFELVERPF